MPIQLNGTTIIDESNYVTTSQLSALESTLKTYTNTNGYTDANTLKIAGKQVGMISTGSSDYSRDSLMTTGTTFQVSSGSTISLGTNPASNTLVVKFLFVPFK